MTRPASMSAPELLSGTIDPVASHSVPMLTNGPAVWEGVRVRGVMSAATVRAQFLASSSSGVGRLPPRTTSKT